MVCFRKIAIIPNLISNSVDHFFSEPPFAFFVSEREGAYVEWWTREIRNWFYFIECKKIGVKKQQYILYKNKGIYHIWIWSNPDKIGRATALQWSCQVNALNFSKCLIKGLRLLSYEVLGKSLNQSVIVSQSCSEVSNRWPLIPFLTNSGSAGKLFAATGNPHPNMSTTYMWKMKPR